MSDTNKPKNGNRRWFLSLFNSAETQPSTSNKIKMLTADGKLVEVDKAIVEAASTKQKSTNREIYDWMDNPSKEKNI
ncbi:MAG: hypothetical protein IPL84_07605 [Chitinophagaceae bacterium]|nr:hypothetical protein [Chitinophagaceae bacterium]